MGETVLMIIRGLGDDRTYTTDASNEDLQKQMPIGRTYITDASDEDLQKQCL